MFLIGIPFWLTLFSIAEARQPPGLGNGGFSKPGLLIVCLLRWMRKRFRPILFSKRAAPWLMQQNAPSEMCQFGGLRIAVFHGSGQCGFGRLAKTANADIHRWAKKKAHVTIGGDPSLE